MNGLLFVCAAMVLCGSPALAQDAGTTVETSSNGWERYNWLQPAADPQAQSASGETVKVTSGQDVRDPFKVLSTGSLWQDKYDALYTRRLADPLTLAYETSSTVMTETAPSLPLEGGSPDDLTRGQKVSLLFQPLPTLTLSGNLHESVADEAMTGDSLVTTGAGFSAEGHLPLNSVLILGFNSDQTGADLDTASSTTDTYNAQFSQPLGKLPVTAMFKGQYQETSTAGAPVSSLPSLEQSLVWKPMQDTTLQMGLRQQHYQEYPGIDNQFNQALFADWSQKMAVDVSWHSYAEVLNTRGMIDQAPASPIASGANGTPQATPPGSNASLTSSLPVSLQDQTLTFSTGPSFLLDKDISASLEYSNRWDKNPAAGAMGDEQRVSVSVKGSF